MTLKEYYDSLTEMLKEYPEAGDLICVYSHDDEGNEYQEVMNHPTICQLQPWDTTKEYRWLKVVGYVKDFPEEKDKPIEIEDCNAVMMN